MSRGGAREKNGRFYAHARYGKAKRLEFRVPTAKSLEDAEARAIIIGRVAEQLVAVGRRDLVRGAARELAEASTAVQLARVEKTIAGILKGARVGPSQDITFEEWAKGYVEGELAAAHPDHVKARDYSNDKSRLAKYILPLVGDVPVVSFNLRHAQLVLSKLPPMAEANRRQIAQVMGRLMHLAVLPGQLISASPLPRGWLPKITKRRHYSCLYPGEEAMLLAHADTAPAFRLFCGILNREGMRLSELLDSEWWQWNLEAGTFLATKTKTGDPRMWALRPDSAAAMKIWRERTDAAKPFAHVAALGDRKKLAKRFRATLKAAGITRAELFETTEHTARLRAHDMRATFVTISLAEGKTETWIRDRTAHKSTSMIDRYRRTARQLAELKMGSLVDLTAGLGWWKGGGKAIENAPSGGGVSDGECTGRESNPHAFTAPEPKFPQPSPGVAIRAETPVESDVAARAETGFHHSSTTPLATSRDAGGGTTPGELDSSTRSTSNTVGQIGAALPSGRTETRVHGESYVSPPARSLAADSKFALSSPPVPGRPQTPGEEHVAVRAETAFPHASPTPGATSRDAGGGITPGDFDSTTARSMEPLPGVPSGAAEERSQALVDVATSLAVQQATWDGLEELAARELEPPIAVEKGEAMPGPAKARERDASAVEKSATRGGSRG